MFYVLSRGRSLQGGWDSWFHHLNRCCWGEPGHFMGEKLDDGLSECSGRDIELVCEAGENWVLGGSGYM